MPIAPEPDSGRSIAIGRASAGIPINAVAGAIQPMSRSRLPDARNIPTATRIATRYGIIRMATWNPSRAPSTSDS